MIAADGVSGGDASRDDGDVQRVLGRLLELLASQGCTSDETLQVHLAVEAALLAAEKRGDESTP